MSRSAPVVSRSSGPVDAVRRARRATVLAAGVLLAAALEAAPPPPSAADLAAIESALPMAARVKPTVPRRLLVFHRTEGFVHESIAHGIVAFRRMGEVTGAYTADASDSMDVFTPETLGRYDAVLFLSTTQLRFADPAHRAALLAWLSSGRGLVGVHAATDNFPDWPEAQACIGGRFHSHPWNAGDVVSVKLDDREHPVNAAFLGEGFRIRDEIYQIVGPYDRGTHRVLLSLDWDREENHRPEEKLVRADRDFPIAWLKSHGAGRVFYSSLGHRPDVFMTPAALRHFLDGIQHALGDLEADATASASVRPVPAVAPGPGPAVPPLNDAAQRVAASPRALRSHDHGLVRAALPLLEKRIAAEDATVEPELLAVLEDPATPVGGRDAALRLLARVAGPGAVPVVAAAAAQPETSAQALAVLMVVSGGEAAEALASLVERGPEQVRPAAVDALSRRGDPAARAVLVRAAAAADPAVAVAAWDGLARLGAPSELAAVRPPVALRARWQGAVVAAAAAAFTAEPRHSGARRALEVVIRDPASPAVRVAALGALGIVEPAEASKAVVRLMAAGDPSGVPAARLLARWPGAGAEAVRASWSKLPASARSTALQVLAPAGGSVVTGLALDAVRSPEAEVRAAGLAALAAGGDGSAWRAVLPLLTAEGEEGDTAAAAVAGWRDPAVGGLVVEALKGAGPVLEVRLLRILRDRREREAFGVVVARASAAEVPPAVRAAAIGAAGSLAGPGDLSRVAELARHAGDPAARRGFEEALVQATLASSDPAAAAATLLALARDGGPETLRGAWQALALLESPDVLAYFRTVLDPGASPGERRALLRLLGLSQNPAVVPLLVESAASTADDGERRLAVTGALGLLNLPVVRRDTETAALYEALWAQARDEDLKKAILERLRNRNHTPFREVLQRIAPEAVK